MENRHARTLRVALAAIATCAVALSTACAIPVKAARDNAHPVSATTSQQLTSSTLSPGIVIDTTPNEVYIMHPGGGIEPLDLDAGHARLISVHVDHPLFIADGSLLARVESAVPGFTITALDADSDEPDSEATSQVLPLQGPSMAGGAYPHKMVKITGSSASIRTYDSIDMAI